MKPFEIRDTFYRNGEPFQVLSGSIHYFRVVPEYWRDRLEKLKAMGLNTVETYIPWNLHEPKKGEFCFSGLCDVEGFVRLAQELGLYVILRPSPYICAEWEFGGLPAWLLAKEMHLRCNDPAYLRHVREYYDELIPRLVPLQITHGGPVIMMQVENEYGSYGDDKAYLAAVRDMMLQLGVDVPLVTSDGPNHDMLSCGRCEGVFQTGNFGSHAKENFDTLQSFGIQPQMCMEFWCGWFDHWGEEHHTTEPEVSAQEYAQMLPRGHVNIYMFHGGTSFGLMNGANYDGQLGATVTSYDYDALLTEDGRITEKYRLFKKAIEAHLGHALPEREIPETAHRAYERPRRIGSAALLGAAKSLPSVTRVNPVSMERLGQDYGYILYHTTLVNEKELREIRLFGAMDRAQIFLDGKLIAVLLDHDLERAHAFETPIPVCAGASLDILVENLGRVNYGPMLEAQRKGIDGGVQINCHFRYGWEITCIDEKAMRAMQPTENNCPEGVPGAHHLQFDVDIPADTYLDTTGWGKGVVILNGFTLGRFWEIGPQKRLYIPAPLLRKGQNDLIVIETEGKTGEVAFFAETDWN